METFFFFLLIVFHLTCSTALQTLFSIQETLTILCYQFPLVSTVNDSSLQCARLRINQNALPAVFDLDKSTQMSLFIIVDQPSSNFSPVDITINLSQASDFSSSINEIRISLLVTHSNFTINNQTTKVYTPSDIPILLWQNSIDNTYDLIDLLQLDQQKYITDTSLCQWNINQWNRLFSGNKSINSSYGYILKTQNPQLTFTLVDTSNQSSLSLTPSPYLDILYCFPYKLGITEIVLIVFFGSLFFVFVIILSVVHYLKAENHRTRHSQLHHNRERTRIKSNIVQHRTSASMSSVEQDDQTSY